MTELKKVELGERSSLLQSSEELRGWINYFNELLEEDGCIECIKVNKNMSTETKKHFDLYCDKCEKQNKNMKQAWKNDLNQQLEKEFFHK